MQHPSPRYFVAPPAIHPSGTAYEFLPGLSPAEIGFAELPATAYAELVARARRDTSETTTRRPPAAERVGNEHAVLSRGDLRELGFERRAVDAIFRALPVVVLPGYSRPVVRVRDYLDLLERSTYDGRTRVR